MAVPKQKHTKSRRNKRRMHIYLKPAVLSICPQCKKPIRPHTVCLNCGYYKGREIIDVFSKLTKKERKKREREMKAAEKGKKKPSFANAAEGREKPLSMEELSKK